MKLIKLLHKESGYFAFLFVFFGLISGGLNAAIMPFINSAIADLSNPEINYTKLGLFLLMILLLVITQRVFAKFLINITQRMIYKIRLNIVEKIRMSNYYAFEKIGKEKVYASITRDATIVSHSAADIVHATTSAITVVFCLAYLAYLSWIGFAATVLTTLMGMSIYWVRRKSVSKVLSEARSKETVFFKFINELLDGFKEVKVDQSKNDDLFENHIKKISYETRDLTAKGIIKYLDNSLVGQVFFMMLIGFVIFVLPKLTNEPSDIISYIFVVLYIIGPIEGIMTVIPGITQANISLTHIEEINKQADSIIEEMEASVNKEVVYSFEQLSLCNVEFNYATGKEENFGVGPIKFQVKKGELIFIAGGNGSGKTTLFKILTGLYKPSKGQILVNNKTLSDLEYRQLFSPIYSDFHLFEKLYGYMDKVEETKIVELIKLMGLEEKVKFSDFGFSSTSLSTGQRKRLAFIAALIENKPILVLDEWAADQDPQFRKFFYHQILPDLKKNGTTIIAITHDDNYFNFADRLYKMEEGQLKEIARD